jgi:hypothetical protein
MNLNEHGLQRADGITAPASDAALLMAQGSALVPLMGEA